MLVSCTLFAIRPYYQAVCHQVALSDPSLYFAPNPHPNIAMLLYHQKYWICDPSEKSNGASSSSNLLSIASNGKCLKATLIATIFSCRGVKQILGSSALLRPACHATWPYYGGY